MMENHTAVQNGVRNDEIQQNNLILCWYGCSAYGLILRLNRWKEGRQVSSFFLCVWIEAMFFSRLFEKSRCNSKNYAYGLIYVENYFL